MKEETFLITVPGSSANLGPGFDSIGLAVSLYLRLEVQRSEKWEFESVCTEHDSFPRGENNLICQTALQVASRYERVLPGCRIKVNNEIPLARGLGSSGAAIVAGIELANELAELNLSLTEKLTLATEFEGHPDNVGASLYGGLFVGSNHERGVSGLSFAGLEFELLAAIPSTGLSTEISRSVLPQTLRFADAVQASANANLLLAALLKKDWKLAGQMMSLDRFHQPYRGDIVPHYQQLKEEKEAFGVYLSGAGPTVMLCCEPGKVNDLADKIKTHFSELEVRKLSIENKGSEVLRHNMKKGS